ncbi:MAG: glutathione S-transferase N-terminal domain-containing protein [Myxococcota bacterium]
MTTPPLTWPELEARANHRIDRVAGPTNAPSRLRLFGATEADVRVTLYRDHHAWCPYCQKIWLWLEERRVPYRVRKVTMFCYGDKEPWFLRRVPSGMLPALELDGDLITESDVILGRLEGAFGPLGPMALKSEAAWPLRQLERALFGAWCAWLCRPARTRAQRDARREAFRSVAREVERALESTDGPWFGADLSAVDLVFVPYVERMNASLFYYKGYSLREEHPAIDRWLSALERRPTYLGTQSDIHTHVHDLPPQMGGCFADDTEAARRNRHQVDEGPWDASLPDTRREAPPEAATEALSRVVAHRDTLLRINPAASGDRLDHALRAALTTLVIGDDTAAAVAPPAGTDAALRYVRDRINVPRDMSLHAARALRTALEATAARAGDAPGPPIPTRHRRDQDPAPFRAR